MQTVSADTTKAFDAHAQHYDAIVEPNALLQNMRTALWNEVTRRVAPPARVLDVGCGTGIDAQYFAQRGYHVTAIDASREMVNQTRQRLARENLNVRVENLGAEELEKLGDEKLDAIYSDLGPLNCAADLENVSKQCAAHLKPRGYLIVSVMARTCPIEILYFTLRGDFKQATRRFPREMIPVNLENGIVWTRYYDPREFFKFFKNDFQLVTYRALNVFLPPPYLIRWYQRAGVLAKPLARLDARVSELPFFGNMGDHFLMTIQKR
jgi:SAM-dependent methyltransferase